jgi:hypothetical protein
MTALCILLFAAGGLVRDGWPATGSTHLARFLGGFLCGLGVLAICAPLSALTIGSAIWLGFYLDQKHGDGQSATGWRDAGFLLLSGVTSLVPLAGVAWWLSGDPHGLLVLLLGLAKIPIWFGWWAIEGHHGERRMTGFWPWLQPTRLSAICFYAAIGAVVALLP